METIKNYLEAMFASLPNTEEVIKAKSELEQMMEDKYNELLDDGVNDNEAVGKIISEFGNLDELAEELGITSVVKETDENMVARRKVSLEEVKSYLQDCKKRSLQHALGVMLCILSVVGPIICEPLGLEDSIGACSMFIFVAIAVVLFVYSSVKMQKWSFLKTELCMTDFATTNYVKEASEHYRSIYALQLTIGIVFCIICFLPAILLEELDFGMASLTVDSLSGMFIFIFVAIGVFIIVHSSMIKSSYTRILKMNDVTTISGNYVNKEFDEANYTSKEAATVMSVFWPTVSCLYLSWSFLTFDWHITWIIWPIAGIASKILNTIFKK